jgi:hypothetical protein
MLLKKCYCIASILTELLFEEFRLAIPLWRFFLRVIEHTSDTLDLLKIIHECPYEIAPDFGDGLMDQAAG